MNRKALVAAILVPCSILGISVAATIVWWVGAIIVLGALVIVGFSVYQAVADEF